MAETLCIPILKNVANQVIYFSVTSQADGQFQVNPTIAAGDFQRSIDGGAFANMDNLPAVSPAGSAIIAITLSATEANFDDNLIILGKDAAGVEWNDILICRAASVWDERLTASNYNIPTSAGRRLRDTASSVIITGTAVSATVNTIVLDNDASGTDGAYDPAIISIVEGMGAGESRLILQYEGATKTAAVDRNWKIQPDNTSQYVIVSNPGREHVNEGLAQGGTVNTITLNALASDYDNAYNGQIIFVRSGTGEDQAGRILAYDGTTKVATIDHDWVGPVPDTTTAYVMLPTSIITPDNIKQAAWGSTTERTLTQTGLDQIWENVSPRTLTTPAVSATSSITDGTINIKRGDYMSISITGLGSLVDRTELYFTVKPFFNLADSDSMIMISEDEGLLYIVGEVAETPANGTITVTDENAGDITITLAAVEAAKLFPNKYLYDVEMITADSVVTLTEGPCNINADVTRAVS